MKNVLGHSLLGHGWTGHVWELCPISVMTGLRKDEIIVIVARFMLFGTVLILCYECTEQKHIR